MSNSNTPEKKPFELDINFEDDDFSTVELRSLLEEAPRPKGEIYFSNPPGPRSRAQAPAEPPKKKKKPHGGAAVAAMLAVSVLAAAVLSFVGISALRDIFAMGREGGDITLEIPANQSTGQVIDILHEAGLIRQRGLCKLFMRFTSGIKEKHITNTREEYVAGPYMVNAGMGLEELLDAFKAQPKTSETASLLFPEGYTVKQIAGKISENRVTGMDAIRRAMMSTDFDYPFLNGLNTDGRYYRYEGYLFPDTYEFYINENANNALRRMFDNFAKKWVANKFNEQAAAMGLSIDQVVILASIIQKEAADASQMKDVSGVLHNRLNHPADYPMLECDSTRDYVMATIATEMDPGSTVYWHDMYNTYRCVGLPAGPICSPGIDAISAALNPGKHSYYYFQHDKNGKIYLSKTKAEHNRITLDLINSGLAQ